MPYATCKACGKELSKEEVYTHLEIEHPNIQQYRCMLCGNYFEHHSEIEVHMDKEHPGYKKGKATITKEFTFIYHSSIYQQRGNPSTPEIPVDFEVTRSPNAAPGFTFFKGKWWEGERIGTQFCNKCGLPLVAFLTTTDDPDMNMVYIPIGFRLNEVHFKDITPGRKYALSFKEALESKWTTK